MLYRPKFIISFAIFVFLFSAGFVLAAWRDAPAGPPNYDELTPGSGQADYKPMNLGSVSQIKQGNIGVNLLSGNMPSAKIAVNQLAVDTKIGSSGDAVYAYANSFNAAISVEQANNSGYAIYASGGMNYFSGNVGIGTTGPSDLLHIVGTAPSIRLQDLSPTPTADFRLVASGDNFYINDLRTATIPFFIQYNGNVGIGTVSPNSSVGYTGSLLHLYGPQPALILQNTSGGADKWEIGTNWFGGGNTPTLTLGVNPTYAMAIQSGGNVGIGTTGPGYKLDVQGGQINASGGLCMADDCKTSWAQVVSGGGGVTGSGSANYVTRWTASDVIGISAIYDDGSGNVNIGTASPSSYRLNVAGDIYASGSGTAANGWFVSSDARLKKNVETLSGALDKIGRVRGVSYDLVNGTSTRQIGVIAQELEQEFPELVVIDGNGYKAVAYDRLSAVLIEAVKELQAQNQTLQSRLDLLEKK